MERLNAYIIPGLSGTISIDVRGMIMDLVTITKAGDWNKTALLTMVGDIWKDTDIEVGVPFHAATTLNEDPT